MTDTALRPCPFCGGAPEMWKIGCDLFNIYCTSATCGAKQSGKSMDEAMAAWNRRTIDADVERVARAIWTTPLMVPGTLRDLLCATTYANDHVIALLLQDAARAVIAAMEGK